VVMISHYIYKALWIATVRTCGCFEMTYHDTLHVSSMPTGAMNEGISCLAYSIVIWIHPLALLYSSFHYLNPRVRISPLDFEGTSLSDPAIIHFVCSPARANDIVQGLQVLEWNPITVYEPIPDQCIPEELPTLRAVLPYIDIFRY
jgi:hypothetical protein